MLLLATEDQGEVTAVGHLPAFEEGNPIEVEGTWIKSDRWGRQFLAERVRMELPESAEGILKYLSSGLIPGVGKEVATRLVKHFKEDTLRILDEEPSRVTEVRGIGKKRAKTITTSWSAHAENRKTLLFLYSLGLSTGIVLKLQKHYGPSCVQVVRTDPYKLASDIWGIGFKKADAIGAMVGIEPDSPKRIRAGVSHVLSEALAQGHVCLPREELLRVTADLLKVDLLQVEAALQDQINAGQLLVRDFSTGPMVYLRTIEFTEAGLADMLSTLHSRVVVRDQVMVSQALEYGSKMAGVELTDEQQSAVHAALQAPLTIITGGPGTGKTTVLKALVHALQMLGESVALCAPTGRAAKRMAETSGKEARTIHRLLEYDPQTESFGRNQENPLASGVVIVDEVSMIDLALAAALAFALPEDGRLVLVGDQHQLQSVGPGSVLRDLIASSLFPVAVLSRIHRQAATSLIITNAHRILHGQPLAFERAGQDGDFFMVSREAPEDVLSSVVELVATRIPSRFSLDPVWDVQVITPMYKGILGADSLNNALQTALNPGKGGVKRGHHLMRAGDKVMQTRNDYEKEVFNGDIGVVKATDDRNSLVTVEFSSRLITYDREALENLVPAYAITVHKSQGSEYQAVVFVMHTQHFLMLKRNLMYTAVTRGRRLVVLAGSRKAVEIALRNDQTGYRYTNLSERLLQRQRGVGAD